MPLPSAAALALAALLAATGGAQVVPRTDADIRETVARNARDVRRCYENEGLRRNPELRGVLEVELTIRPTGIVDSAAVRGPALGAGGSEVARCVRAAVMNWRFARGPYELEAVVLPFELVRAPAPVPVAPAAAGGTGTR